MATALRLKTIGWTLATIALFSLRTMAAEPAGPEATATVPTAADVAPAGAIEAIDRIAGNRSTRRRSLRSPWQ